MTAAVIGYLSVRFRVVPIVGFLLAGVLIGPAQLGLVRGSAVFFVSVGMLLDLGFLLANLPLVLAAAVVVLAVKAATTTLALLPLRVEWRAAAGTGLLLGQVGEFSFVLLTAGAAAGLAPAGLGADGGQVFVATTVLLMVATPLLAAGGRRLSAAP